MSGTQLWEKGVSPKHIKVALVGNPNVGKSVIFNYLTGLYVDVSNYPGTTIEILNAPLQVSEDDKKLLTSENGDLVFGVTDTPGVYGVSSLNDEEKAARDHILDADIVVNVVSSTSLDRDLFLTKQLCDMGKPMIMVLNLMDEAKMRKLVIDVKTLSRELGVNIIEAVATKGQGLDAVRDSILDAFKGGQQELIHPGKISQAVDKYLSPYLEQILSRAEALMVLEGDEFVAERNKVELTKNCENVREKIYQIRRDEVNELVARCVSRISFSKRDFLGRALLNPFIGSITAFAVLYLFLFQFLGIFIAGTVVDFTEKFLFRNYYEPLVRFAVSIFFPIVHNTTDNLLLRDPLSALGTFLAGDYGVLTLTITYLYGLLAPLVLGFYFGLAILEDSGYLPRLAVLVDGVLSKLGMNGRAIVPLILGGGCVTMATVTTRLLRTKKEKIITMTLLGLTIPCSAQLGVIQGLLSNIGGPIPWLIWSGTLFVIFAATGLLLNKLMPGDCGNFIADIPPLRIPRIENIWKKTYSRSKIFLNEATPAFFIAAALVAGLQVSGTLKSIISLLEPAMVNVLLLPKEVSLSFILGMVRRDFGAFGLMDLTMTHAQLITACLVLTLFVPCIATVAVMIKESNFKTALAIWFSSWLLAFGIGGVVARVLEAVL